MKYLISFIGTGGLNKENKSEREYRKASYIIDKKEYISSFVSSCIFQHFEVDKLILIGTAHSMWEEVYRHFGEILEYEIDEDRYVNCGAFCEQANHSTDCDSLNLSFLHEVSEGRLIPVVIPYGLNEKEQTTIFEKISSAIEKISSDDEIFMDVTHSFRSLPLYVTSCLNYVSQYRDQPLTLNKIYYGMLEVSSEMDGKVPIVDISTTLDLNNWAIATHSFKEYGKGDALAELLQEEGENDLAEQIEDFSDRLSINSLADIKASLANLQKMITSQYNNVFAKKIIPPIIGNFVQKLQPAAQVQSRFQLKLAEWHYEHSNYASAYLVLIESIVTYVCEENEWNWKETENRTKAKDYISKNNFYGLREPFTSANKIRNNIAHSLNRRGGQLDNDIDNFKKVVKQYQQIINTKR